MKCETLEMIGNVIIGLMVCGLLYFLLVWIPNSIEKSDKKISEQRQQKIEQLEKIMWCASCGKCLITVTENGKPTVGPIYRVNDKYYCSETCASVERSTIAEMKP